MRVERSAPEDVPAIEMLPTVCGLPVDGAAAAFCHGVIAHSDDGSLLGSAAVELYGADGLLRSVAVRPDARSAGVGRALVQAAQDLARAKASRTCIC